MPSGADLEYQRMLAQAGISPASPQGYDGARLEQLGDSIVPGNGFSLRRAFDPRNYGAVGDGVVDDTAAIQACINAAGIFGVVELPPLAFKITASLVLLSGTELRGSGTKASRLMVATDISAIIASGGQGEAIRSLKIWNTWVGGARTTYDIDITNPTKTVIEDVEVDVAGSAGGANGGGIRFKADVGLPGNAFMPMLSRVWIRQGTLMIDGVTDGHVVDAFIWAQDFSPAAIHCKNSALWTFMSVDAVPGDNANTGYLFDNCGGAMIIGGYCDGSYSDNPTGYGIRAINSERILVTGHSFYHNGRSAVQLETSHGCVFSNNSFQKGNKQNNFYPDINLVGSTHNTFANNVHTQPDNRANKGAIYVEDGASTNNQIDDATLNQAEGNFYAIPVAVANVGTLGSNNRPRSLWPRPSSVPNLICPPASIVTTGATGTWPAANRAYFHRFHLSLGGVYRYARLRVDVGSGNMQVSVVKLEGLNYTRMMTSGVVVCTAGGQSVDMGATYLAPGEYALVIWCDNVVAQWPLINGGEAMRASQLTAELDIAGGIVANGAIVYSCTRAVAGATLIV